MSRRGIMVALSGVDSAGKSTQRDLLVTALSASGRSPVSLWTRAGYTPGLRLARRIVSAVTWWRKAPRGDMSETPGRYPRRAANLGNPLTRRLWLTAALLDLLWVYCVQVRVLRALGRAVVCDRYLLDCLVDFRVNFPGDRVERWLLCRMLRRLAARPDAAFCLMVPGEVSAQRSRAKARFHWESAEDLERRGAAYRALAETLDVQVLDAQRPVAELSDSICQTVVEPRRLAPAPRAMPAADTAGAAEGRSSRRHSTRGFLRGSTLLLVGRLISIGVNFAVQVLAVRYLAKADYGAFAWALAIASMGASTVLLGLNRGVARYVPIYHEHREYGAMFGTVILALATVAGLGLAVAVLVLGASGLIHHQVQDELSVGLLLLLIGLVPLDALDALFETLLAVFAGARSIFVRRYLVAPGLKLAAVFLVIAIEGSVYLLAAAYLLAGAIGIALYVAMLWRALAREGLLGELRARRLEFRARTLFGFSLPLLSTDLLLAVETPMVIVMLEHFRGTTQIAELRAAEPVAGLCLIVFQTFKILFRPHASRLFAQRDEAGLGAVYWRSTAWITVATFPIFAICLYLAEPLTLLLYGQRYAGAGILLAVLAAGKYFNAALGTNTYTLQVYGRVKLVVWINAVSAATGVGLCLWLIPGYGAVGGAAATAGTSVIRNVLYQAGLMATTRVGFFPRRAVKVYLSVLVALAALAVLARATDGTLIMAAGIAVASLGVAWLNRRYLKIGDTFPELAKLSWFSHSARHPASQSEPSGRSTAPPLREKPGILPGTRP